MGTGQKQRKLIWILLLLLAVYSQACARKAASQLPRVAQGHIQWLERQSMLGAAQALTSQVSASERLWQNSASDQKTDLLLDTVPNWLAVSPHLVKATPGHFFTTLAASPLLDKLSSAGINGLFLAPTGERSDVWTTKANTKPVSPRGENVCTLRFDAQLGTDKDFENLVARLDQRNMHLGGQMLPVATGLGPDFMLQARNVARFTGMYAMFNVPQKLWDNLPKSDDEWDCQPLNDAQQQFLASHGIVPQHLMRDTLAWASPGGWAITGQVRGVDGNPRRWVYRYAYTVLRPLLLWQDPSGLARRIASAAIIRHTGLQRQVLAGLSMEPLLGLEPGAHDAALATGCNAIEQLGLEIHRYGGWSLHSDALPPEMWPKILTDGLDFCADHATQAAILAALETGDVTPLVRHLAATISQRVPHKRLARGLEQDGNGAATTLVKRISDILQKQHASVNTANVRDRLLLILGIRAGLPGLCFVSHEDLTGATALAPSPLWDGKQSSHMFAPLSEQWEDSECVANQIMALLHKRQHYKLATATLERVEHIAGEGIAIVNALPLGGYWITVANFSGKNISGKISLPRGSMNTRGNNTMELGLKPLEIRHIIFAKT